TIALSLEERRGRGMGTTYIALEIGIGTGALVAGWLYGNQISHLPYPFWVSAGVVLVGFLSLLLFYNKRFTRTSATQKEKD
ncbi:MAG: MFS transporter, partial [Thermonemataceae bacterium]